MDTIQAATLQNQGVSLPRRMELIITAKGKHSTSTYGCKGHAGVYKLWPVSVSAFHWLYTCTLYSNKA